MIWLLGQIGLCLLLAAIGGWYVGWTLRGFRERDRVEDLRRTLRTTEEIKRRELGEAEQRIGQLEGELAALRAERRRRAGDDRPQEPPRASLPTAAPAEPERADTPGEPRDAAADADGDDPSRVLPRASRERLASAEARCAELERERDQLRARLRAGEQRLQQRESESVALRAEAASLRRALQDKAEQIARLEASVIELEPLRERLQERDAGLERLRQRVQALRAREEELTELARQRDRELGELRERLHARDREINTLRVRAQDAEARAELTNEQRERHRQELADCSRMLSRLEQELAETRQRLQRQIERNRKQEVIHRSVVEELQRRLQEAQRRTASPPRRDPPAPTGAGAAAAKPAPSSAAPKPAAAPSEPTAVPVDDLKTIHGIGPKIERQLYEMGITRYEQIAAWTDEDVARVAARLRAFPDRIRRDRWVEQARELAARRGR